jgi:tRNA (adenine37-N6)-methyltransferase
MADIHSRIPGQEDEMKINYQAIGVIHSPFKAIEGMPIQPVGAQEVTGTVEVFPEFSAGLNDLDGFSHIILLYHFHRSRGYDLCVVPFMDTIPRGLFATRSPKRPNPIGISVVKLIRRENSILHVQNLDILDGTPLLDIKPYVPEFDQHPAERIGWLAEAKGAASRTKADNRFR